MSVAGCGGGLPASPTPDGSQLVLSVRCGPGEHAAFLRPDWTAELPHDLEAERTAVAFGGTCDCLHLVDRVLPAARRWLDLQLRAVLPPVPVTADGKALLNWCRICPDPVRLVAGDLPAVAEHMRSVAHVAAQERCDLAVLHRVTGHLSRAHGLPRTSEPPPAEVETAGECVAPRDRVLWLWQVGVRPDQVLAVHEAVGVPGLPLPAEFYVQLLAGRADARWLRAARQRNRYDDFLLDWLFDAVDGGGLRPERAAWVQTRLPGRLLRSLSDGGYFARDVQRLAKGSGLSLLRAGRWLDVWLSVGARPSPEELLALVPLGLSPYAVPSRAALDRLTEEIGAGAPSRTELALLLLVAGSVLQASVRVRAGVLEATAVARAVAEGRRPLVEVSAWQA